MESIALDSAALNEIMAAAGGGTFAVGGRVISPTLFASDAPDELVFGFNGEPTHSTQLMITMNTLPEPSTLVLFGSSGLWLFGVLHRKLML